MLEKTMQEIKDLDRENTIQAIKDLDRIPTKKEWNELVKEHGFLSTITLRAIYKKSFFNICKEIRR